MMQLLELDVACPKCGTRPNLRVTPRFLELVGDDRPEHVLGMWQCQGPRCLHRVVITAGSVQRATPAPLTVDGSEG